MFSERHTPYRWSLSNGHSLDQEVERTGISNTAHRAARQSRETCGPQSRRAGHLGERAAAALSRSPAPSVRSRAVVKRRRCVRQPDCGRPVQACSGDVRRDAGPSHPGGPGPPSTYGPSPGHRCLPGCRCPGSPICGPMSRLGTSGPEVLARVLSLSHGRQSDRVFPSVPVLQVSLRRSSALGTPQVLIAGLTNTGHSHSLRAALWTPFGTDH